MVAAGAGFVLHYILLIMRIVAVLGQIFVAVVLRLAHGLHVLVLVASVFLATIMVRHRCPPQGRFDATSAMTAAMISPRTATAPIAIKAIKLSPIPASSPSSLHTT